MGGIGQSSFDHLALFNAVKAKDVKRLRDIIGPTLIRFGSYQVEHWDHALEGIVTSLKALPGEQGYSSLRWAEEVVNTSHQSRDIKHSDPCLAEYVYRLRADLLLNALARIADFKPAERPGIQRSIISAIDALGADVAKENMSENAWFLETQRRVADIN